ncbi:MAG TPA: hypothetical protein VMF89_01245, partial [Polyangiales bacterium]|nr:hypothetical protein [Polyangiales bacterium]
LGPTGVAAHRSPAFLAFEHARPVAAQHEALLMEMLQNATPAGRLYAALLLARAHSARASEAWHLLAEQHEPVSYAPGGCSIYSTTLAEFARGVLRDGRPGLFPPADPALEPPLPRVREPRPRRQPSRLASWFARYGSWLIGIFWLGVVITFQLCHR